MDSRAGNTGVHDTVADQLPAKIDGVEQVKMEIGLPDEHERIRILNFHTARPREHKRLNEDVDIKELATLTKNFSGAEIESLVQAATRSAINRIIKVSDKVEVDLEAAEKLQISKSDFLNALENDVKTAYGTSVEQLDDYMVRGIINWGRPVSSILEKGELLIQQAKLPESAGGLVSILLEGPPNCGKTALAAQLARTSDFPFLKICSPEDMIGFTESAKCMFIHKIFEDAYRSQMSCILVDDIEGLLNYNPIGPRYSDQVSQVLRVLLKKKPPKGRKLLILCTTSERQGLEEMRMLPRFTGVLHVPNLSTSEHLMAVLEKTGVFDEEELLRIHRKVDGKRVCIGIKILLALIDTVQVKKLTTGQCGDGTFLTMLNEEGAMEMSS